MSRKLCVALVLAALCLPALLGVACSAQSSAGASSVQVMEDQNGKSIEVKPGQVLNVSLKANPSTGYTWEVSQPVSFLQLDGEPEFKADTNAMGAPGRLTLHFKVTGTGSGQLQLVYHRSWEKGVAPISTYSIDVTSK